MTASDKSSLSSSELEPSQNNTISPAIYKPYFSPNPTFRTPWNFETGHTPQAPVICSASTLKSLSQALAFITATLEDHSEELDEGVRVKFTDVSSVLGPQIIAALVEDEDCFRKSVALLVTLEANELQKINSLLESTEGSESAGTPRIAFFGSRGPLDSTTLYNVVGPDTPVKWSAMA